MEFNHATQVLVIGNRNQGSVVPWKEILEHELVDFEIVKRRRYLVHKCKKSPVTFDKHRMRLSARIGHIPISICGELST
jgi:hypothetical protein